MPRVDLPDEELVRYRSSVAAPRDLAAFWADTLAEARASKWDARIEKIDAGLSLVDVFDVTFSGFDGEPIKAWLHRPAGVGDELPIVIVYAGYFGGRCLPHQVAPWPLAGYACLSVDNRGQGTGFGYAGDTPDRHGSGPSYPGFVTRGILDQSTYYYRRAYTDAVLAVDAARALPGIDGSRVVVAGVSQGGGVALAVAGLTDGIAAVMADVPFLCDFPRGAALAETGPYPEVAGYLGTHRENHDTVFEVLAYFDACVLVQTATAPALFSVALMDRICPPSTVYAAYNAYAGPKEVRQYPFNDHEGGQFHHEAEQLRWLASAVPSLRIPRRSQRSALPKNDRKVVGGGGGPALVNADDGRSQPIPVMSDSTNERRG